MTRTEPVGAKVLESDDLSEMFGIEMALTPQPKRAAAGKITTKPSTAGTLEESSNRRTSTGPAKLRRPAPKRRVGKPLMTPAKRRAVSARMKEYWAARRALRKRRKDSESS
jgi:hypothetical protein